MGEPEQVHIVALWEGPQCQMCHGTGVARMIPGDRVPVYVRCPACNGHGREPS